MAHNALQTCQGLYCQTRYFLEAEPWKTVPWQHTAKTFEDRLMEYLMRRLEELANGGAPTLKPHFHFPEENEDDPDRPLFSPAPSVLNPNPNRHTRPCGRSLAFLDC